MTAGKFLRALDRDPVTFEREREGGGVATPPRDLQRLFRKADSAIAGGIVACRPGQAGKQPDSRGAVVLADGRQRTLQQRDERGIGAGACPGKPSAIFERRPGEPVGATRPFRERGSAQ